MNKNKIRDLISIIDDNMDINSLTNEEYLVFIANQLISFGRVGILSDSKLSKMNINDSIEVGLVFNTYPDNPFVASILQGHAILKWSEYFKE